MAPFCHFRKPIFSLKPEKVSDAWLAVLSMVFWVYLASWLMAAPWATPSTCCFRSYTPLLAMATGACEASRVAEATLDLLLFMFLIHLKITGQLFRTLCLSLGLSAVSSWSHSCHVP